MKLQVCLYKWIQIPVQHIVHVSYLYISAMVLDKLIGLEHIRPDLAPPGDVFFLTVCLLLFCILFCFLLFVEPGLQDLHGNGTVFMLGPLILALDNYTGRQVGNTHSGTRLVDVLSTCPACPVCVYT